MILALDISLNTAWACGSGSEISFGTRSFEAFTGDLAILGRRFHTWLEGVIEEKRPNVVVIETPFYRHERSSEVLIGLVWEANRVAEKFGLPRKFYAPITIKKFITGNAKAKKPEVMEAVRKRGFHITNDHEADAVALNLLHQSKQ